MSIATFERSLHENGMIQSMNTTGNCYDNAMAESFIATIKKAHIFWHRYRTRDEVPTSLFQ